MKFGGASVKNAEAIRRVGTILQGFEQDALMVVVSAMDKTTNQLETLAFLARDGQEAEAWAQFERVRNFHLTIVKDLFADQQQARLIQEMADWLEEIRRIIQGILWLEEFLPRTYDRIVSYGELMSSFILGEYLNSISLPTQWLDARKLIVTDASHKQAGVIWSLTEERIQAKVRPQLQTGKVLLSQGFIGATQEGKTTTLGREGSDYSGAIFAHCLEAADFTVWKDVPGILNADPRLREDTIKLDQLSYQEAVEMTFFGASVIHPKTIKPLYNKQIPMRVKCFLDASLEGSAIGQERSQQEVPRYITKKRQALLKIQPRDFSFMEERQIEIIFQEAYKSGLKINLLQRSAISLLLCVDDRPAIQAFGALLKDRYEMEVTGDLKLQTTVNYTEADWLTAKDSQLLQVREGRLFALLPAD
ncbi:MAG: aspartate kinase [Bacteroidota bacterium]